MSKDNRDFFKCKCNWSIIKDNLLSCYLKPYFAKLLHTRKPIFYIDCFAGKGLFDDGNFGSPLIAMKVREECCGISRVSDNLFQKIELCFIEKSFYKELEHNIANVKTNYCKPIVIAGSFESDLVSQLAMKRGYNIFIYIDPYGIKFLNFDLFDKLNSYCFNSIEVLINFNSFGFFREACRCLKVEYANDVALTDIEDLIEYEPFRVTTDKKSSNLLSSIAGGDYWKDIVLRYRNGDIDGYDAEKELSAQFANRLRNSFKYVLDMPIRIKKANRPKYRMIHACNYLDGCLLMAENILKRNEELYYDVQEKGQLTLFGLEDVNQTSIDKALSDEEFSILMEKAINKIQGECRLGSFLADFYNDNGVICTKNKIVDYLNTSEMITVIREPAYTRGNQKSTFWTEDKRKKIYLRRM